MLGVGVLLAASPTLQANHLFLHPSLGENEFMSASGERRANIVLIGFMGSGKSSVGRRVARNIGFLFIDTDKMIAEQAGMEISQIFANHGEPYFRGLETALLESLCHSERAVISTGGGIILAENNRRVLRELGLVVALTASEEVIIERIMRNSRRPLLQTPDPRGTVRELLAARRPFYESTAHFVLDTSQRTHAEAADAIVAEARRSFSWERRL